jgi:ubiquinone/menaquinone biosynthesis C-methylase UbiE
MQFKVYLITTALSVLVCVGCETPGEKSVKPGINDNYKNDPNIEEWVNRLEAEDREVRVNRDAIVRDLRLTPGMVVADIGAGTGIFIEPLSNGVGPKGRVFAVDIAKNFLDHITTMVKDKGLKNVRTVLCKEDAVQLPAGSIDLAFVCDTYHHFEYPRSTMRSIHRALRPGGVLVVVDFERIPGKSREWILGHVRADKAQVETELRAWGFQRVGDPPAADYLDENYLLMMRKVD